MERQSFGKLGGLKQARDLLMQFSDDDVDILKSINMLNSKIELLEAHQGLPDSPPPAYQHLTNLPYPAEHTHIEQIPSSLLKEVVNPVPSAAGSSPPMNFSLEREVVIQRDFKGIVGVGLMDVDEEIYVAWLQPYSPAYFSGLKVGDKLLSIQGGTVQGQNAKEIEKRFKGIVATNIIVNVSERPFEINWNLEIFSSGQKNIVIEDGKASLASNPQTLRPYIVKVNGQSVLELKDKYIQRIIDDSGPFTTVTVVPKPVYKKFLLRMRNSIHASEDGLRSYMSVFF